MGGTFTHRLGVFGHSSALGSIDYIGGVVDTWANTTSPNLDLTALTGGSGGALQENDLVVVFFGFTESTPADPEVPTLTGYTAAHAALSATNTAKSSLRTFYKFMGATPDTVVNLTADMATDQSGAAQARVYRGVNTTTPMDVAATTATGDTNGLMNPPAITPSTVGAAVVTGGIVTSNSNLTSAQVVGELDDYGSSGGSHPEIGVWCGHLLNWTSGAVNPSTTGGNSSASFSWCAATLALRPA